IQGKGEKLGSLGRTEEGSREERVIIRIGQTRMLTVQAQDGEEEANTFDMIFSYLWHVLY
ncbi:hypothetical protein QQF64_023601, partial [Cirrhinus molitorella]